MSTFGFVFVAFGILMTWAGLKQVNVFVLLSSLFAQGNAKTTTA